MTIDVLVLLLVFGAGLLIGRSFGMWRARDVIQRGMNEGRYTLTVARSFRRQMARERKLKLIQRAKRKAGI